MIWDVGGLKSGAATPDQRIRSLGIRHATGEETALSVRAGWREFSPGDPARIRGGASGSHGGRNDPWLPRRLLLRPLSPVHPLAIRALDVQPTGVFEW